MSVRMKRDKSMADSKLHSQKERTQGERWMRYCNFGSSWNYLMEEDSLTGTRTREVQRKRQQRRQKGDREREREVGRAKETKPKAPSQFTEVSHIWSKITEYVLVCTRMYADVSL